MVKKQYYSQRKSKGSKFRINLNKLVNYFDEIHTIFFNRGCFNKVPTGRDIDLSLDSIEIFNKEGMLPFHKNNKYSEEDVFDLIEFFYDCIDTPRYESELVPLNVKESYELQKQEFQAEYREKINRVISKYEVGYEITDEGYIREIINNGLEVLIDSSQVIPDDIDSENRIKYAKRTFFHHGATEEDKRGAIFEVGAVLEKLRDFKQLNLNKKDEGELFTVLNSFSIRHNRKDQKPDYDKEIFYPWIFYNLLAAVDASLKLQRNS